MSAEVAAPPADVEGDAVMSPSPADAAACKPPPTADERAERLTILRVAYRGTGLVKRTGGFPTSEYIQKKRKPVREKAKKPTFEIVLDLGKKLGLCRRCTCPVHEADITDGYAVAVDSEAETYECKQTNDDGTNAYADSCAEYAAGHPEDVAKAIAEGWLLKPAEEPAAAEGDASAAAGAEPEAGAAEEAAVADSDAA